MDPAVMAFIYKIGALALLWYVVLPVLAVILAPIAWVLTPPELDRD